VSDAYLKFSNSKFGKPLFSALGLAIPPLLTRYRRGDSLVKESVVINVEDNLALFKACFMESKFELAGDSHEKTDALIFDATNIASPEMLNQCHAFFSQQLSRLSSNGKILIVGLVITSTMPILQAASQRALTGIVKSIAKEVGRKGCTANLIYTSALTSASLGATSRFLLSNKSAYVSGQVLSASGGEFTLKQWSKPLQGKTALVTGASRGIGAAIAQALAADGANVIGLDIPQAKDALEQQMATINGQSIILNITDEDAGAKISQAIKTPLDIVVHNAGITRDKTLKRMSSEQWQSVIDINLMSVARINEYFFANRCLSAHARIVCVSSISGIAGNVGQVNYAASKSGIIGLVEATARKLTVNNSQITINAVAPGFIETAMTAKIPLLTRHFGRRMCALSQGGLPVDVAQAIVFFCAPNAQNVSGNTLRVCGQNLIGA